MIFPTGNNVLIYEDLHTTSVLVLAYFIFILAHAHSFTMSTPAPDLSKLYVVVVAINIKEVRQIERSFNNSLQITIFLGSLTEHMHVIKLAHIINIQRKKAGLTLFRRLA